MKTFTIPFQWDSQNTCNVILATESPSRNNQKHLANPYHCRFPGHQILKRSSIPTNQNNPVKYTKFISQLRHKTIWCVDL